MCSFFWFVCFLEGWNGDQFEKLVRHPSSNSQQGKRVDTHVGVQGSGPGWKYKLRIFFRA